MCGWRAGDPFKEAFKSKRQLSELVNQMEAESMSESVKVASEQDHTISATVDMLRKPWLDWLRFLFVNLFLMGLGPWHPARSIELDRAMISDSFSVQHACRVSR